MKSFLHGKKTVHVAALAPGHVPLQRTGAPASGEKKAPVVHAAGRPAVEVVKEGDKVVRVYVTCSCGERIELECLYPAGA
jgi:hypothetical protein